jgi:hypothetical protein
VWFPRVVGEARESRNGEGDVGTSSKGEVKKFAQVFAIRDFGHLFLLVVVLGALLGGGLDVLLHGDWSGVGLLEVGSDLVDVSGLREEEVTVV